MVLVQTLGVWLTENALGDVLAPLVSAPHPQELQRALTPGLLLLLLLPLTLAGPAFGGANAPVSYY